MVYSVTKSFGMLARRLINYTCDHYDVCITVDIYIQSLWTYIQDEEIDALCGVVRCRDMRQPGWPEYGAPRSEC